MTELKLLALTPFFGAGLIAVIEPVTQSPAVEYTALALCAIVVMFLCNYLKGLTTQHREERAELVESLKEKDDELAILTKQNTESYNRLSQMLRDRPCLMKDSRMGQD